jgi:hypothetical protein
LSKAFIKGNKKMENAETKEDQVQSQQAGVNDPIAIEKARAEVAEAAKAKKVEKETLAIEKDKKGVKIVSHVNMIAKDGTRLFPGKESMLSQKEHERLSGEARFKKKPLYTVVKK